MFLTKKRSVKKFRKHWEKISIVCLKNNIKDNDIEGIKFKGLSLFSKIIYIFTNNPKNLCYLCQYDNFGFSNCGEDCLLKWPGNHCMNKSSPYSEFSYCIFNKNFVKASRLAKEISELPQNF
jgi:hypothetical protein